MIVVAILSVVAALAVTSYARYLRHSAKSEVYAMLGEIRTKEEAYLAEFSAYVTATHTSGGSTETDVHPALLGPAEFKTKAWGTPGDVRWGSAGLGINPPRSQLYCGYVVISGAAGSAAPGSGTAGASILANVTTGGTIPVPWFYARGCCDFDSNSSSPTNCPATSSEVSMYEISFNDNVVRERAEK
jgi:type II secretory pathway pseudopilin PulG